MASLEAPVERVWVLQVETNKCLPVAVACVLVEPTLTGIPLWLLNPHAEPVTVYAGMTLVTLEEVESP